MDFRKRLIWAAVFALAVVLFGGYRLLLAPPAGFPSGSIVIIAQGASASFVAQKFADAHIIAQPILLQVILRVSGKSDNIQAGAYSFQTPQNLFSVAYKIIAGEYGLPPSRITFPEGTAIGEMATQIAETVPGISAADFLKAGKPYEGYLFPDTYFFPPATDAGSMVKTMRANFNAKTAALSGDITASEHSLSDIVIMASLIEKEARASADKRIIAGILWNRINIGMPLQVDASRDTYAHTGFPLAPICNPGFDSLEAALHPTRTDYLFYLTGKDGLMHYATTYAGHQANLRKYLN